MSIIVALMCGAMFGALGTAAAFTVICDALEERARNAEEVLRDELRAKLDRGDACPYCEGPWEPRTERHVSFPRSGCCNAACRCGRCGRELAYARPE